MVNLEVLKKIISQQNLSSKFLKGKIDILGFNTEIEKKYRELGKETYNLMSQGKLMDPKLKLLASELDDLYSKVHQPCFVQELEGGL